MRKKIGSIALAGALAAGIAAPAPAMAVENTSVEYAGTLVQSAQSLGLAFITNPIGTFMGSLGMGSMAPIFLSSWFGLDTLPD